MLYAGCVNLKSLPNLNFNKMMMMMMMIMSRMVVPSQPKSDFVFNCSLFFIMALSILSLNCNGIRDQSKRNGLLQWLRSLSVGIDIVCLQETHCVSQAECSLWFRSSGFDSVVSGGSAHSWGCIVLFRPSLSLVNSWCDPAGRFVQCEFQYFAKLFRVCCIYGPNRNPARDLFLDDLHFEIDPSIPTVLAGDFNSVFDRALDRLGSDPSDSSREALPLCRISLIRAVLLTSGGAYTRMFVASPGPGGMVL